MSERAMPTLGPARVVRETPCCVETPHGRISVGWTSNDGSRDEVAEFFASHIATALNAATACSDMGLDPIRCVEQLPKLVEACAMAAEIIGFHYGSGELRDPSNPREQPTARINIEDLNGVVKCVNAALSACRPQEVKQ